MNGFGKGISMNTKCLVTFKTILEMGSFQKAADKLGYTQSTVTFQIRQLEEEFSLELFEKIGRHMELTQAGREINQSVMEKLGLELVQRSGGRRNKGSDQERWDYLYEAIWDRG